MRVSALLPTVFIASAAASSLAAQEPSRTPRAGARTIVAPGAHAFDVFYNASAGPRAVIGVSTTSGAHARDTLGVLVASVRSKSPAEHAGIQEGNRIASINGVSLRLAPADVGDEQMAGMMARRLSRELDKVNPGDTVDLRIVADGQTRSVNVKTVARPDLIERWATSRRSDDRTTLGLRFATTGSARDTLGVFVLAVDDSGPAAKAGIVEGSRIASINGADVRETKSVDDDDYVFFRASNANRLEREIADANPGDAMALRVYYNGQYRDVKVQAVRQGDLPRRTHSLTIIGGGDFMMPSLDRLSVSVDPVRIENDVRRAMDVARVGVMRSFGRRVDW